MRMLLKIVAGLVIGYLVGAVAGGLAVDLLSSNSHDKSQEVVMTAAFVTGPLGALIGVIMAAVRSVHARRGATGQS